MTDVIDTLAGIAPGSALDKARDNRPEARKHAQASYDALFNPKDFGSFGKVERTAVATFVAIWQKASCGVRMLIACQLRLSTSTMVLFKMSLIKAFARGHTFRAMRCLFFVDACARP